MKTAKFLLFDGVFGALLWFGLFEGVPGARNLVLALVWWLVLVAFLAVVLQDKSGMSAALDKTVRETPVLVWLRVPIRLAVTAALIWAGYIVTGIAYCLASVFLTTLIENKRKEAA